MSDSSTGLKKNNYSPESTLRSGMNVALILSLAKSLRSGLMWEKNAWDKKTCKKIKTVAFSSTFSNLK